MQRPHREDFLALLYTVADGLMDELTARMLEAGFSDVRGAHGCVFGNIDPNGMRLTELADRAAMTKQAVGEAVSDLEGLGYAERVADPSDGRAKIIRLTDRGRAAQVAGFAVIADIEEEWVQRFGASHVADMRALLLGIIASKAELARAA